MESLSAGQSPSVNVRVTEVRKTQLQRLAELEGERNVSNLVRRLIDEYIGGLHSERVHGNKCPQDGSALTRADGFGYCSEKGHRYVWDGKTAALRVLNGK